jgi:hypothetical protein
MIDTNYIHQYITHSHFRHTLPYVLTHKNINIKSLSKRYTIPPPLLPSLRLAAHASDAHTATHGGGPNATTTTTTITDFPFYVDVSEYKILQWLRHVAHPKSKEKQPPAAFCKRLQAPRTSSTPPDTLPVLIPPPPPPRYLLFFSYPDQSNPLTYPTPGMS